MLNVEADKCSSGADKTCCQITSYNTWQDRQKFFKSGALHGVLVRASAQCTEAPALNTVIKSLSPILADLFRHFYAIHCQLKATMATKRLKMKNVFQSLVCQRALIHRLLQKGLVHVKEKQIKEKAEDLADVHKQFLLNTLNP